MAKQQGQSAEIQGRVKVGKRLSQRKLIIATVVLLALVVAIIWILSSLSIIPNSWAAISSIIVAVFGTLFTFLQLLHLFLPPNTHEPSGNPERILQPPSSPISPIAVQLPTDFPFHAPSSPLERAPYRGIVGLPPPADPRTIQQREHVVREVYAKLIQPDITAIVLTGIGGVGKSTIAALIYRYAEEQRKIHTSPFLAETLWLVIDPAVTFADIAGNLFEAMGKVLPDFSNLAPQNQAVALFNALNTTDKPRLVILDQFENLLNWDTGHALTDRPGVGEWLDIINSQQCACRILLTSRPRPIGTREYPSTYLQEYPIGGLEVNEGIELLKNQGVQGTETELQTAVLRCAGHAFSLTLLASLMRDHHMNLTTFFKNSTLWTGDIATSLLDQIYTQQLNEVQRELLLAFSVYREPVPLEATQVVVSNAILRQISAALNVLLTQHLLEAVGEGYYQLHAIIADYALGRFGNGDQQANEEALRLAHTRAAQYYLQRAAIICPPREQRRGISDVHELIEAIWQYCQAGKWQEAYDLMEQEEIFADLNRWGGNAILLELYQPMLDRWSPQGLQAAHICKNLGWTYIELGQIVLNFTFTERALQICVELQDKEMQGAVLTDLVHNHATFSGMTR